MALADPSLSWPRTVVDAFVNAGLVNEYNVPKLLAQSGALLGKKPQKQQRCRRPELGVWALKRPSVSLGG